MVRKMHPPSSISEFFGMVKCHKIGEPLRGICTGFNSIVSNSETFIKELLQPLVLECEFAIDNQIAFKNKFLSDKEKFDPKIHRVISIDVEQMYSNVNVPRTISYILDKIYEDPKKYFPFSNGNGTPLTPPTREKLKMFLLDTFQNFSIFRSPIGVYKQKSGLAMGSSVSASLATIFVNLMEQKVVKKYFLENKLISYQRYADDVILLIEKNTIRTFMKDIHSFDGNLKFTLQEMDANNELIFLDSKVFLKNNELNFIKYRKMGSLTVISNFQHSLMSPKYLKGGIITALHREKNACSTEALFHESLEELKDVFYLNSYPEKLVESKIKSFLQNSQRPERPPNSITVCFNYNSPNMEQYIYKLTNKMTKFIPDFRINVSFRTVKIKQLISRQSKALTEKFETSNTVYQYDCPCSDFYIGQSGKTLIKRCGEHLHHTSNIGLHIADCPIYKQKYDEFCETNTINFKTLKQKKVHFIKQFFKILKKGFRSKWDRLKREAYLIRLKRPTLNDQNDSKKLNFYNLYIA